MTLEEFNKLANSDNKLTVIISKGISPAVLLGIAFIVLKLTEYISWSWLWVLAPFWIYFAFYACAFLLLYLIYRKTKKECKESATILANECNAAKLKEEEIKEEVKPSTKVEVTPEKEEKTTKEDKKSIKKSTKKETNGNTVRKSRKPKKQND